MGLTPFFKKEKWGRAFTTHFFSITKIEKRVQTNRSIPKTTLQTIQNFSPYFGERGKKV